MARTHVSALLVLALCLMAGAVRARTLAQAGSTPPPPDQTNAQADSQAQDFHPEAQDLQPSAQDMQELQTGGREPRFFRARLHGDNQVPTPVNTQARAVWDAVVSRDGQAVEWALTVRNVNQMTMAHIHQGDAQTNGPVIVWLVPRATPQEAANAGGTPKLNPPVSGLRTFRGKFTAGDIGGPLAGKTIADLVQLMKGQGAYINVHTVANPGGEIRGQTATRF